MSRNPTTDQKLLIVEDDEGLRRQYRWVFPEAKVTLASTREEAVASIAKTATTRFGLTYGPRMRRRWWLWE